MAGRLKTQQKNVFGGVWPNPNFAYRISLWAPAVVFSCAISCHTEFAHAYVRRQYRGYVHSQKRRELQEPNHPRDVIGSHNGISIYCS